MQEEEANVEKKPSGILDKYRERYKDRTFESDDDFHQAIAEEFDDLDGYRTRNVEANRKLAELFETEPELVAIIRDMYEGASFREAIAANVDLDDLKPMEGDPDYEAIQARVQARKEKIAANSKLAEELDANQQASLKEIEEFVKENELDQEGCMELLQIIDDLIADAAKGKISKNLLSIVRRHLSHDNDVKEAHESGLIDGRNEKIETIKEKESGQGDGLPTLGGGGASGLNESRASKGGLSSLGLGIELGGDEPLKKLKLK